MAYRYKSTIIKLQLLVEYTFKNISGYKSK